ncbi:hypothetical protein [Micromonospora sp. NPDC002575]|uniref:hypothetical protein n=1 Tax=Micromonospora sp. NPDC002575 TaxID=3364222 RepID=UPI0036C8024B
MRGDLDETLARLARREEALRRREADPGDEAGPQPADALPRQTGGVPALPAVPALAAAADAAVPTLAPPADTAGPTLAPLAGAAGRDPVDEVAEAVARVVAAHPGMAVVLRVEHAGQAYPLRVGWLDGRVTVGAEAATVPPPVWPLTVKAVPAWPADADRLKVDPAARLAELIRRDPSLLDGTDP